MCGLSGSEKGQSFSLDPDFGACFSGFLHLTQRMKPPYLTSFWLADFPVRNAGVVGSTPTAGFEHKPLHRRGLFRFCGDPSDRNSDQKSEFRSELAWLTYPLLEVHYA